MENTPSKWSKVWPKQAGTYWFYGDAFAKTANLPEDKKLILVDVRVNDKGYALYIAQGYFIYKSEASDNCYWMLAQLPELPNEENNKS